MSEQSFNELVPSPMFIDRKIPYPKAQIDTLIIIDLHLNVEKIHSIFQLNNLSEYRSLYMELNPPPVSCDVISDIVSGESIYHLVQDFKGSLSCFSSRLKEINDDYQVDFVSDVSLEANISVISMRIDDLMELSQIDPLNSDFSLVNLTLDGDLISLCENDTHRRYLNEFKPSDRPVQFSSSFDDSDVSEDYSIRKRNLSNLRTIEDIWDWIENVNEEEILHVTGVLPSGELRKKNNRYSSASGREMTMCDEGMTVDVCEQQIIA
jgi:hypothetical protein